ncbi:MAG: glycosyltransferase [Sedimentisphaerales bacterium]|nr:glycosyltransferase [Sedimentisphaerales bacterium]
MLSVLIPSRNEFLLAKTIETILAAAHGDIEIIAVLDGCRDRPKVKEDSRVTLIRFNEPMGQRHAVNEAAKIAKGKYILKTDAHSTFDKGFDVKLIENCEYDWTVIPRMYNLHAFDWVCKNGHTYYQDKANPDIENKCPECGEILKIKYVWKIRKHKRTDFMYMDKNLRVQYWGKYEKKPEAQGDIVDVMNGQGACWFQHKERFFELGGLDEKHGSWGQVGCEIACKAWLSGGSLKVNKKTWFAHVFRTTGSFGFPYHIRGSEQEKARRYSRDLWLNNKWPLQKRKFSWLIEKFDPPGWDNKFPTIEQIKTDIRKQDVFCDTMYVDDVWEDRLEYCESRKCRAFLERYNKKNPDMDETTRLKANPDKSCENFFDSFRRFTRMVLDGESFVFEDTDYYKYLINHLNPHDLIPEISKKGRRHITRKIKNSFDLIKNIQNEGMREPLDMWRDGDRKIIRKGMRRLVILKEIGIHTMPVRVWKNEDSYYKYQMQSGADLRHIPKKWRLRYAG